ncbi:PAS domain S-box protein, partial [Myxococcota bacterium]|nr:PAS domain S-box protein [Myxococcota bacterium]
KMSEDISRLTIENSRLRESAEIYESRIEEMNRLLSHQAAYIDLLFESAFDARMILSSPDWKFTAVNSRLLEIFKVDSKADFLRLSPWDISPPFQPDGEKSDIKALEMIEKALAQEQWTFSWIHKRLNGDLFSSTVKLIKVGDGTSALLIADVRDNTELEKTHAALLESERLVASLIKNIPGFFYRCRNSPDWPMLFISEGCFSVTGYVADDFINGRVKFGELVHPDYRDTLWHSWQNSIEMNFPLEIEYPIVTKSGSTRWIWERGRSVKKSKRGPCYLEGFITDITERKRNEEKLKQSEEFRQRIFDSSILPIVVMDGKSYCFIDCNDAAVKIYGYRDKAETLGKTPADVSAPEQYDGSHTGEKATEFIEKAKRFGYSVFEWLHQRPDGTKWDAEVHLMSFFSNGKQLLQFSLIDITEKKKSAKETLMLQDQLNQAQKMDSIGRLAGGVAHDYNNMLSVIIGYTEMAISDLDADNPVRADLGEVLKAANMSSEITRQLLAFARKQPGIPQNIDLNKTIGSLVKMLSHLIGENIMLNWIPGKDISVASIDPLHIEQILVNLCINARDAIAPLGQGAITIKTSLRRNNKSVDTIEPNVDIDGFFIEVSDNGEGMDEDTKNKIFEPFFTTKGREKGTGLGLSVVYGLVNQNNGYIEVQSQRGVGTTFRLFFPCEVSNVCQDIAQLPEKEILQILIYDPYPFTRKVILKILEKLGYRAIVVDSFISAAECISDTDSIGLIIVNEDEMDDTCERIVREMSDLRKIIISSGLNECTKTLPPNAFLLTKPFTVIEFEEKLNQCLSIKTK